MRILGVDLGARRVGLAVSDDGGMIASPLRVATVRDVQGAVQAVCQAANEVEAGRIVLGFPRDMSGKVGLKAREAESFADALRAEGLDVVLWDERLTTAEAERSLREANLSRKQRKRHLDAVAAQRILQAYLACH